MELRCQYNLYGDQFDFLLRDRHGDRWSIGTNVEFQEFEPNGFIGSPTFRLKNHEAQMLMDELWSAGLRPTQGKQTEGQFAAQGRHLEDMRAIAFAKLKISSENT